MFTPFHKPPYTYPYGRSIDETTTAVVDDVLQWSLAHHCDLMVIEVMP
jgi:hypothetical protein